MKLNSFFISSFFIRSILVISIFLLIFIASVSYKHTQALKESTELLVHSYKIQNKLEQLLSSVKDAETGQRGYIISHDSVFLEPYNSGRATVQQPFLELKSLTANNVQQYYNLDSLMILINLRFSLLQKSLDLVSEPIVNATALDQNLRKGKNVMDSIRQQINKMTALEVSFFEEHQKKYAHEVSLTPSFTLLLILFSLLVFILSFIKINNDMVELERRNAILDQTTKELEQSNNELASFNHIASHDLQEPLRKIQTFISRFSEQDMQALSETGREYLVKIQTSAKQMRRLINDLLLFSRSTKAEKTFEETDLNELLDNVKQELMPDIEDKKALINCDNLPALFVIPFQIQQLFVNLVGNSLKYSRQGVAPIIKINSEIVNTSENLQNFNQKYCRISVTDNGIGFEQKYAESIFGLFFRLHKKDEFPGSGIGLSICKKIAENHNGYITAEGKPDVGSTFAVYLPV
jgi:signal transduction histidine kinase